MNRRDKQQRSELITTKVIDAIKPKPVTATSPASVLTREEAECLWTVCSNLETMILNQECPQSFEDNLHKAIDILRLLQSRPAAPVQPSTVEEIAREIDEKGIPAKLRKFLRHSLGCKVSPDNTIINARWRDGDEEDCDCGLAAILRSHGVGQ